MGKHSKPDNDNNTNDSRNAPAPGSDFTPRTKHCGIHGPYNGNLDTCPNCR